MTGDDQLCRLMVPSGCLWSVIVDEAVGPIMKEWRRKGYGICLPALVADTERAAFRSWGERVGWVNVLTYIHDILLLAMSEQELVHVHQGLRAVCA